MKWQHHFRKLFAPYEVKNAPIELIADAVIALEDIEFINTFAKNIKNAPVDKLAQPVIKNGNIDQMIYYARNVKGAPVRELMFQATILIEKENPREVQDDGAEMQ